MDTPTLVESDVFSYISKPKIKIWPGAKATSAALLMATPCGG